MALGSNTLGRPLLYVNKQETVALIDIPTAISCAQGDAHDRVLLSSEPRSEPYPSNEPKTDKAKENLRQLNCNATGLEGYYRNAIRQALEEIRRQYKGNWCLPRQIASVNGRNAPVTTNKENPTILSENVENPQDGDTPMSDEAGPKMRPKVNGDPLGRLFHDLVKHGDVGRAADDIAALIATLMTGATSRFIHFVRRPNAEGRDHLLPSKEDPGTWEATFSNLADTTIQLTIEDKDPKSSAQFTFLVPPKSTCVLAEVENAAIFRSLVRDSFVSVTGAEHPTKVFDFICLDPPWPNSSARRKNNYNTIRYMDELLRLLKNMDLDQYINDYVGIWITNKPAMRKAVLGKSGLFDSWNVQLVEEWIYAKTTTKGEPITTLDGLWRKPYEVFLLGRAPANPLQKVEPVRDAAWSGLADVRRRVIVAVPDFHSRKPCLKPLVERWLGLRYGQYEALEIFARYCVAGWWSWGNECLRFNAEQYWERAVPEGMEWTTTS